jgi:hypothetical protein
MRTWLLRTTYAGVGIMCLIVPACRESAPVPALPVASVPVRQPVSAASRAAVVAPPPVAPVDVLRAAFADAKDIRDAQVWNKSWVVGFVAPSTPNDYHELLLAPRDAQAGRLPCRSTILEGAPTSTAQVDLDGDGTDDLVAWTQVPVDDGVPAHDEVLALRGGTGACEFAGRASRFPQLLWGVRNRDEIVARLPLLKGFVPPAPANSTESLVLNLALASRAELRALIATAGLAICSSAEGNARPHRHNCKRFRGAALTDAVLNQALETTGYFANWGEEEAPPGLDEAEALPNEVKCTQGKGKVPRIRCIANTSGPEYAAWVFEGEGASRRLVEVDMVAYEDT